LLLAFAELCWTGEAERRWQ